MSLVLQLRKQFSPSDWQGGSRVLLIAWLVSMISLPIVEWLLGERGLLAGVVLSVCLQAGLVVLLLGQAAGWPRAAAIAAIAIVVGWAAEAIGSKTGVPFGAYHYTARLQPQLLGVPLLIPLAWLMMLPPAWAVGQRIVGRASGLAYVLVSALAFTAWDLFLDPQMVHWGLWAWDQPGQYFGIPLVNYAGWVLVSALITLLASAFGRPLTLGRPLLVVYTLTWLIETVGLILFWGMIGPALAGFVGMGLFVGLAWTRSSGR